MAKVRKDKGWFYVRKNRKPDSWSIYYQWFENEKQKTEKVDPYAYPEFGFRSDMTLVAARERVSRLNQERKLDKNAIRRSAANLTELRSLDKLLFPPKAISAFNELLESETYGSDQHLKRLKSHFYFVQKMMIHLQQSGTL